MKTYKIVVRLSVKSDSSDIEDMRQDIYEKIQELIEDDSLDVMLATDYDDLEGF